MYIIMDLDATLLNNKREVSNYTKLVLKKLQNQGHVIVINTARSFENTKKIIIDINANYSILNGGALIVKGLEKIYENVVCNKTTQEVIDDIILHKVNEFSVQCDEGLFCNKKEYEQDNILATYFNFKDYFPYNASKILLCSESGNIPDELSKKYKLKITHYINGPWYRLSMCNKLDGNLALFKLLNDNNPKSICFGDDIGDLEMLEDATVGVALVNSVSAVLEKIDNVTVHDNDNDGVAKFLENYFKI